MTVVDPASSFATGNAPAGASYAAPLLNFSTVANYPNAYFQGQQNQRKLALQNAFPNGIPMTTDAQGNKTPDVNAIINTGAKLGGADYVSGLLPLLLQSQIGQQGAAAIENSVPPSASSAVPSASGPANIRGPQQGQPQGQPQLSSAGADNNGADTVRSVAVESFGGKDVSPLIPRFAAALGVDPDAPLTAAQAAQARSLMTRTAQNTPANQASDAPLPSGGASGAPAPPPSGPQQETASPATGIIPNGQPSGGLPSPAAGLVPQGYDPVAYSNALSQRAMALRAQAARVASFPNGAAQAKVMQEQAQAFDDKAKQIIDSIRQSGEAQLESALRAREPTPETKNLQSGTTQTADVLKGQITQSQKTYNGIQALANQYETDQKPYLDLSRSILNDPSMYTGTGANLALDFNRVRAALGAPQAAMLQEALQKVTASNVLGQINQQRDQLMEAGGTAGRIFAQQVDLVEKAAPQLSTTLGGNRFLVEVSSRMGQLNTQIRDMAQQYMTPTAQGGMGHQFLDPGFDKMVANYLRSHPIFSKEELSKPALLGAPTAPPNIKTPQDAMAWSQEMGLKPGDAIRTPNGYRYFQGTPNAQ